MISPLSYFIMNHCITCAFTYLLQDSHAVIMLRGYDASNRGNTLFIHMREGVDIMNDNNMVVGIFSDSKRAGDAIGELKAKGYTKDISVISKDVNDQGTASHQVKQDLTDGAAAGAGTGAVMGALAGLLAGAAAFAVPGIGWVVLGPLATSLTGAAAGALTGGMVGTLVDWGIPDEKAKDYERRINSGEVLVTVTADETRRTEAEHILRDKGASEVLQTKGD